MRYFTPLTLLAPALIAVASGPTLSDIAFHGTLEPSTHEIRANIISTVNSRLGHIPVGGHVRATYTCDGSIDGTMSYGSVVRLLARLKHVTLATTLHATMQMPADWDCSASRDTVSAHFAIRDTLLTGSAIVG